VDAGCGTATIDGHVGATEWATAGTVPLYEVTEYVDAPTPARATLKGVGPSQDQLGDAYFMNDGRYMYLGAILRDPEGEVPNDAVDFMIELEFAFEDEPADDPDAWVDCTWEAASCQEPEDEGMFIARVVEWEGVQSNWVDIGYWAAPHELCPPPEVPHLGVTLASQPRGSGVHLEMRIDLGTSPLSNPDPGAGDCFDFRWMYMFFVGRSPTGGGGHIEARWPAEMVDYAPYDGECTILCLNPCAVEEAEEEFVPEPVSVVLLGCGLAGMAGYATLRWRSRK
jgi:hypothetical protein